MFRQPSKSFRRSIRFTGNMSARRCVFQHGEVGIIGTRQRILTQSPYTEIRQTETFALRNIHRGIKVYQISRRAMSLISGFSPVPMRPLRPLTGEILLQQFTESFTIIGDDTPGLVRTLPCRQKLQQVFFQFITATRQKLSTERPNRIIPGSVRTCCAGASAGRSWPRAPGAAQSKAAGSSSFCWWG